LHSRTKSQKCTNI